MPVPTIHPWQTSASRTIVDDEWLRLRAETCKTHEGAEIDPYYLIDCPDWVAVIAITSDEQLLLVRQYRHGAARTTLELPGGWMLPGETPADCAQRELIEETGYAGEEATNLAAYSPDPSRYTNALHVLAINGATRRGRTSPSDTEQTVPELFPLSDAPRLFKHPDFVNIHHAAALGVYLNSTQART